MTGTSSPATGPVAVAVDPAGTPGESPVTAARRDGLKITRHDTAPTPEGNWQKRDTPPAVCTSTTTITTDDCAATPPAASGSGDDDEDDCPETDDSSAPSTPAGTALSPVTAPSTPVAVTSNASVPTSDTDSGMAAVPATTATRTQAPYIGESAAV